MKLLGNLKIKSIYKLKIQVFILRPGATPHLPKPDQEEDPGEIEKYCIKMCQDSAEEGKEVVATGYCVECEQYMSDEYIEAHKKTKLTKEHNITEVPAPIINHPRKDAAEGREVKKDSEGYLVRIYRCGTIMGKGDQGSRWGPPGGHPGMMGPGGMMAGPGGPMMGPGGWGGPMMGPGGWGGPMMGGPRHPGPGFGHPGGPQPGGPGDGAPGGEGGEGEAPVKSGLVNDPMAGIGQGPPGGPPGGFQGGPGQWGPGPGWGGPQGGPGGWGGPPGPWGPRPPGPPMICVSQGVSGKICNHFRRGQCQYGNRCIHVHLMPNPAHQMAPPAQEESDDEDGDEEGEGGETKPDVSGSAAGPGTPMGAGPQGARPPLAPQQSMFEKREAAKSRAFEEAMAAAKAAAAKTGDLSSHLVTNRSAGESLSGGGINVMGPSIMHAYSVGQKSKKKDPKPEEQRPGDWQCECGNYNFAWRKECNACGKKKPFNQMEEETKQQELARIKAEREKRRQEGRGGGGGGRLDPGDLRNRVGDRGDRRDRDRDRDRDRGRGDRDRRSRDGGGDNPNMVPLGGSRGFRDDRDKDRDRDRGRDDRDRDRGRDDRDRDRDRGRDDKDRDRDRDRGRDREDDREKDRGRDRDKERSKDKHKDKKDKSRDRDREDSYHKEKKEKKRKKSKDEYEDYEDDRDTKKHKRYYDDYEEESSSKKSKKSHDGYDDYDRESSAKKHKKSHKASKDNSDSERDEKKKKKKKDKDKDKEERRRQRRSQEEEGEIPGDWGEWYDQANTNRRGAERY